VKNKIEVPFEKKRNLWLLLIAACILNIYDYFASIWLIKCYGYGAEGNPLMRYLFSLGPNISAGVKLGIMALSLVIIPLGAKKNFYLAYHGIQIVVVVLALVGLIHMANILSNFGSLY